MSAAWPKPQLLRCSSPKPRLSRLRYAAFFVFLVFVWCTAPLLRAQVAPAVSETFRQASEAMRSGNLDQAVAGFSSVVKLAPTFSEAHFNLGLAYAELGRHNEAIVSFEKALALKPKLRGANLFLGVAHYKLNQFDTALADLKKEAVTYPKDAGAWMWLGVVDLA